MDSLWIYLILIFFFIGKALIKSAKQQTPPPVSDESVKAFMNSRAFERKVDEISQTSSRKNPPASFMPERPVEAEPATYTPSIQTAYKETPRPVVNDTNYTPANEAVDLDSVEDLRRAIVINEILNRKY